MHLRTPLETRCAFGLRIGAEDEFAPRWEIWRAWSAAGAGRRLAPAGCPAVPAIASPKAAAKKKIEAGFILHSGDCTGLDIEKGAICPRREPYPSVRLRQPLAS